MFDIEILLPAYTRLRQELAVPNRLHGVVNWVQVHDEFKGCSTV